MIKVIFIYNGKEISFICDPNQKIKYYCQKICQILNINIYNVYFICNQQNLIFELTVKELIDPRYNLVKDIIILIFDKNNNNIIDKVLIKSNEIICPTCKTFVNIFINDHKISICFCQNNHYVCFLEEKPNQINCSCCRKIFSYVSYKCNICKFYLCEIHKNSHKHLEELKLHQNNFSFQRKEEKNNINTNSNYYNEIMLQYNFDQNNIDNIEDINIFGLYFVNQNKGKCKMLINGNQFDIQAKLNSNFINTYLRKNANYFEIKLILNNIITDMSCMFENTPLIKVLFPFNFDTSYITDMSYMFAGCSSLMFLPDISNWNTINVTNMRYMFSSCILLKSLPDLSKWNTINVTDMSHMFAYCTSLESLPDISKWNTKNVKNLNGIFNSLQLNILPDISNWDTRNLISINAMFYKCSRLLKLPDISKWKTTKIENISYLFYNCSSLSFLPDISKWDISNLNNISYMFSGCSSISYLPDISKWNNNYITKDNFISGCTSLSYLPANLNILNNNNEFKNCLNLLI